jgi:hypothetical protein
MPRRDREVRPDFPDSPTMADRNDKRQEPRGMRGEIESIPGEIVSWEPTPVTPGRNDDISRAYPTMLDPTAPDGDPKQVARRSRRGVLILVVVLFMVIIFLAVALLVVLDNKPSRVTPPSTPTATSTTETRPPTSPTTSLSGSPFASPSSSATATPSESLSSTQTPSINTTDRPPQGVTYLESPVDSDGDTSTGEDVQISGVDFPNSVIQGCPTGDVVDWDSAGYTTFTAMLGIGDDQGAATGETATVTFLNEDDGQLRQAKISLGHPERVDFSLQGAVRMKITCTVAPNANVFSIALGNAAFGR